jgi:hypothetical protein
LLFGVGNELLTANDRTLFSRPFVTLTQDAKTCLVFLFFSPLLAVLCASASLRENALALSHYPSLITHHRFTTLREALCYVPYPQLPTETTRNLIIQRNAPATDLSDKVLFNVTDFGLYQDSDQIPLCDGQ